MNKAIENRERISIIKKDYNSGKISRETAKALAEPIIDSINERGAEIAKKYNKKHSKVSFIGLMR